MATSKEQEAQAHRFATLADQIRDARDLEVLKGTLIRFFEKEAEILRKAAKT